jgi:hypothetical protein
VISQVLPEGVNYEKLNTILKEAFDSPDAEPAKKH